MATRRRVPLDHDRMDRAAPRAVLAFGPARKKNNE